LKGRPDPNPHQIDKLDLDPHQSEKLDPDPLQSDNLDPDPYQLTDEKPKCMEYETLRALFQGFEPLFVS
jgi:hypothetical protein